MSPLGWMLLFAVAATAAAAAPGGKPLFESELLFPPQEMHNHGSCIVECRNGDLLACWYRGSGERRADDVAVMGARWHRDTRTWTAPFVMADTPGFPDTNPCMVVDAQRRLWLIWATILDNRWESALLKCKISRDFGRREGAPRWETEKVLHVKPGPEFLETVKRDLEPQWAPYRTTGTAEEQAKLANYLVEWRKMAEDKLSVRLGWMPRAHPFVADRGRLIVPLYSDGFNFALMNYSDDGGETWTATAPLVGAGNVQPTIARRRDGTLVAYFRDNGPPPQRVMASESRDNGATWSRVVDIAPPDPGAGVDVVVLKSGRWLLVNNNTDGGRHSLAVSVSEDEGRTWPIVRHLERDTPGPDAGSYSYPSILQAKDGTIHVTYSFRPSRAVATKTGSGESIKHVRFDEKWLLKDEG